VGFFPDGVHHMPSPNTATPATLPATGYSRLSQILPFLPIAKSTVQKWVNEGRFPKPIKLSSTVTCWKNEDVHAWLNSLATGQHTAANDA
jgi:prophage regulatory protein